jgi:hypothetical protein
MGHSTGMIKRGSKGCVKRRKKRKLAKIAKRKNRK